MKKGMAAGVLVTIILTIIAFMLIAGVIFRFTSEADDKQAELLCHDSIALRAQTQIDINKGSWIGEAKVKAVPVLCKTLDKKITGTREEIKQQIADKVARCWWMFGEGRYEELLKGSEIKFLPDLFGFKNYENDCFNCYTLLIDESKIEGGPIYSDELLTYMKNTNYPKLKNVNYLKYVQNIGGPGNIAFTTPAILPQQGYTISMMPKNKNVGDGEFWKGAAKVGAGIAIVGVVTGGAICLIGTAGACSAILIPVAAAVGQNAALAGGIAATQVVSTVGVTGTALALGGASLMGYSGYTQVMSTMYGEREISSVYVGPLEVGQQFCGSSDIAGD